MPLTLVPMIINAMIGGAIWVSTLSTTAKIIITVLLVAKFALYFYSALIADSDVIKYIGLAICALMNGAGIIFTAINGIWTAMVPFIVILVLLIVWTSTSIGNPFKKEGKE